MQQSVKDLCIKNKQDGWLPPAYFLPSNFGKDAF